MVETVVKFGGVTEYVLERLVDMGYFQTKTEALRAGVLELGKEYHLLENPQDIEDALVVEKMKKVSKQIKDGKMKTYTHDEVLKELGFKRSELK